MRVNFQWLAPTVWTTLVLTIGTDGSARGEMTGVSPFPRHWIYDQHSPWGQEDSQPLVTVAESALERQLSATIMRGGVKPTVRKLATGRLLTEQGKPGDDIYLLLDRVLSVAVDGTQVGELGPGAVVGERALLEDGRRTATLRAVTGCVIATAAKDQIDRDILASLAELHHREEP